MLCSSSSRSGNHHCVGVSRDTRFGGARACPQLDRDPVPSKHDIKMIAEYIAEAALGSSMAVGGAISTLRQAGGLPLGPHCCLKKLLLKIHNNGSTALIQLAAVEMIST